MPSYRPKLFRRQTVYSLHQFSTEKKSAPQKYSIKRLDPGILLSLYLNSSHSKDSFALIGFAGDFKTIEKRQRNEENSQERSKPATVANVDYGRQRGNGYLLK